MEVRGGENSHKGVKLHTKLSQTEQRRNFDSAAFFMSVPLLCLKKKSLKTNPQNEKNYLGARKEVPWHCMGK